MGRNTTVAAERAVGTSQESRTLLDSLGVAVYSGMLGVTVFGIFFPPMFYLVIRWMTARKQAPPTAAFPVVEEPDLETAGAK